jgi:hypothetical protein
MIKINGKEYDGDVQTYYHGGTFTTPYPIDRWSQREDHYLYPIAVVVRLTISKVELNYLQENEFSLDWGDDGFTFRISDAKVKEYISFAGSYTVEIRGQSIKRIDVL